MHGTVPLGSWISYDQLHLTKDSQDIPKTIQDHTTPEQQLMQLLRIILLFDSFCLLQE